MLRKPVTPRHSSIFSFCRGGSRRGCKGYQEKSCRGSAASSLAALPAWASTRATSLWWFRRRPFFCAAELPWPKGTARFWRLFRPERSWPVVLLSGVLSFAPCAVTSEAYPRCWRVTTHLLGRIARELEQKGGLFPRSVPCLQGKRGSQLRGVTWRLMTWVLGEGLYRSSMV